MAKGIPGVPANFKGKKGRSGRRTKIEEVQKVLNAIEEDITNDALLKLARSKVYNQIKNSDAKDVARIFALPVTLKGITEKVEHSGNIVAGIEYLDPYDRTDKDNNTSNTEATRSIPGSQD